MDKKRSNLGLHSGPARLYKTAEQRQEQWNRGPKVLGPSIATQLVQRGKATKAATPSENNPQG